MPDDPVQKLSPDSQELFSGLCRFASRDSVRQWPLSDALIERAAYHGLIALLHRSAGGAAGPASAALARLAAERRDWTRRALLQTAACLDVATRLEAARVRCLTFKGPAIALGLYGSVELRQYEDIDLLVDERDVLEADRIVTELGFERRKPRFPLSARRWALYREMQHEFGYRHRQTRVALELHWRFARGRNVLPTPFAELYSRRLALPTPDPSRTLQTLSLRDHALALAIHGAMDAWGGLRWLADLPRLAAVLGEADRGAINATATRFGLQHIVGLMGALMELAEVPEALAVGLPDWRAEARWALPYVFARIARFEDAGSPTAGLAGKTADLRFQRWISSGWMGFLDLRYRGLMMPADFDAMRDWPEWSTPLLPWSSQALRVWRHFRARRAG